MGWRVWFNYKNFWFEFNVIKKIDFDSIKTINTTNKIKDIFRYGENTEPQPHP